MSKYILVAIAAAASIAFTNSTRTVKIDWSEYKHLQKSIEKTGKYAFRNEDLVLEVTNAVQWTEAPSQTIQASRKVDKPKFMPHPHGYQNQTTH